VHLRDINFISGDAIMKRQSFLVVVVLLSGLVQPCKADLYFSDDFDDGNTDGWWLDSIHISSPVQPGNWRIENSSLVQDAGPDHYNGGAYFDNFLITPVPSAVILGRSRHNIFRLASVQTQNAVALFL